MVRLAMTQTVVDAIERCSQLSVEGWPLEPLGDEPVLKQPAVGKPISHGQVVDVSRILRRHLEQKENCSDLESTTGEFKYSLGSLLKGSKVYNKPTKPKSSPTSEHQALMAKLRENEEAKAYEKLMKPPSVIGPSAKWHSAAAPPDPTVSAAKEEGDETTFADVNRQLALVFNVLLSVVACSAALWMVASRWSTPKRLALSMGGSIVVAVAEVVVYSGYIRRVREAKERSKSKPETKEIVETWVIEKQDPPADQPSLPVPRKEEQANSLRKRGTAK